LFLFTFFNIFIFILQLCPLYIYFRFNISVSLMPRNLKNNIRSLLPSDSAAWLQDYLLPLPSLSLSLSFSFSLSLSFCFMPLYLHLHNSSGWSLQQQFLHARKNLLRVHGARTHTYILSAYIDKSNGGSRILSGSGFKSSIFKQASQFSGLWVKQSQSPPTWNASSAV